VTRLDALLLALALLVVGASYALLWQPPRAAERLELVDASGQAQTYSLAEARELSAAGRHGPSLIEIREGRARFAASPCPEQSCVLHGWVGSAGETVACLPNAVLLTLRGGAGYDAVNF
jgi:hypothetical protein